MNRVSTFGRPSRHARPAPPGNARNPGRRRRRGEASGATRGPRRAIPPSPPPQAHTLSDERFAAGQRMDLAGATPLGSLQTQRSSMPDLAAVATGDQSIRQSESADFFPTLAAENGALLGEGLSDSLTL